MATKPYINVSTGLEYDTLPEGTVRLGRQDDGNYIIEHNGQYYRVPPTDPRIPRMASEDPTILAQQSRFETSEANQQAADQLVSRGYGSRAWGNLGATMGVGALGALPLAYTAPYWMPVAEAGLFGLGAYEGAKGLSDLNFGLAKTFDYIGQGNWRNAGWNFLGNVADGLGFAAAPVLTPVKAAKAVNLGYDASKMAKEIELLVKNPRLAVTEPGLYKALQEEKFKSIVDDIIKNNTFTAKFDSRFMNPDARAVLRAEYNNMGNPNTVPYLIGLRGQTADFYDAFSGSAGSGSGNRFLSDSPLMSTAKYGYRDPIQTQLMLLDMYNSGRISEESYDYARGLNKLIGEATDEIGFISKVGNKKPTGLQYSSKLIDAQHPELGSYPIMKFPGMDKYSKIQFGVLNPEHARYKDIGNGMNLEDANRALNRFFSYTEGTPNQAGAWNQQYLFLAPADRTIFISWQQGLRPTYQAGFKSNVLNYDAKGSPNIQDVLSYAGSNKFKKILESIGFDPNKPYFLRLDNVVDPFPSNIRTGNNLIPFKKGGRLIKRRKPYEK